MHRSEFEHFAASVRQRLASRATAVLGDEDAAQDVVQDCLLKLWDIRDSLDDYTSPEALALTIVHRMSLNVLRSRHTTVGICDDVIAGAEPSPEDMAISS